MNGSATGLESTDASDQSDPIERWNRALIAFRAAATEAQKVGEWKLQREASDAEQRAKAEVWRLRQEVQLRRVDGEDPQAAGQEEVNGGD